MAKRSTFTPVSCRGALEDINNSISILPANSYAFKNRGLVYLAMKRKEEACTDFMKALSLGFEKYYGEEVNKLIKANCKKPENTMRTL